VWRAFVCALGFLTRLPVPNVALAEADVARSAGFFSWIGCLLGAMLWAASRSDAVFGSRVAALLVVALWAAVTGALHLDGLADTVDGLSGGRGDRARTLEIMRDSRIGAHGAVALAISLLLKGAALERAWELGSRDWWTAPVVARFLCTVLLASFPYAREQGLGRAFATRVGAREWGLGSVALLPLGALYGGDFALHAACGITCALGLAFWVRSRLGGLTGDVHGAAIEVCEIAMLLAGAQQLGLR
jgi:adenosylcobinamide-GDP ribazoletransferase